MKQSQCLLLPTFPPFEQKWQNCLLLLYNKLPIITNNNKRVCLRSVPTDEPDSQSLAVPSLSLWL